MCVQRLEIQVKKALTINSLRTSLYTILSITHMIKAHSDQEQLLTFQVKKRYLKPQRTVNNHKVILNPSQKPILYIDKHNKLSKTKPITDHKVKTNKTQNHHHNLTHF